jgi:O-methyltransferase
MLTFRSEARETLGGETARVHHAARNAYAWEVLLRSAIKHILRNFGYEVHKVPVPCEGIADADLYRPLFSPWLARDFLRKIEMVLEKSLVSPERCYVLYELGRHALGVPGDFWECGVYRGGTALMLADMLREHASTKKLHLFDTFTGLPETDAAQDLHKKGDFADVTLAEVIDYVGAPDTAVFHPGFIPETFTGLKAGPIAFAHIDVDIYRSVLDCLNFIYPRLSRGAVIVFDDYGFPSCPGARKAVDTFFAAKSEVPLCLGTGQAIACRHH